MRTNQWNQRFFSSTRGRIVALLRGAGRTVNELAAALRLTDNAVRAHLTSLERDGLVQQRGVRRGSRKPHQAYELTTVAEELFPKAYSPLLNQLLTVLQKRLSATEVIETLRTVGQRMAASYLPTLEGSDLKARVHAAVKVLGELGGMAEIEQQNDKFFIRGASCPLAALVVEHPQACLLAETLVAEITGATVQEHCKRGEAPQCCFEIIAAGK